VGVAVQHSIFTIRDPRCHAHVLHTREQFRLRLHPPKPNGDLEDTIMYLIYLVWMVAPWKEQRRKPSPSCGRGEKPTGMASINGLGIRKGWIRQDANGEQPQNSHRNPLISNHPHTSIYDEIMFSEARNIVITGGNFIQGTTTGAKCIK
jgi:hypothetical protein